MTWPSGDDPVAWFKAELQAGATTWPNRGTAGGAATIVAGGSILDGGIVTGADSGYAEIAGLTIAPGTDVTIAIRYFDEQMDANSSLGCVCTASDGQFAHRIRPMLQDRNTQTQNRARFDFRWTDPATVSNVFYGNNVNPTDVQQVETMRARAFGGDVFVTGYTTADGTSHQATMPGASMYDQTWTHVVVGASHQRLCNAGRRITGLAVWPRDIGDAAAAAISPDDPEWLPDAGSTVDPASLRTSSRLSAPGLTSHTLLSPASMRTSSRLSAPPLTQANLVAPASMRTSSRLTEATLGIGASVSAADMRTASRVSPSSLTQANLVAPTSLRTLARLSEAALTEAAQLGPASMRTSSRLSAAVLLTEGVLSPASMRTSSRLTTPPLTQAAQLAPASMRTSSRLTEAALTVHSLSLVPASLRTVSRLSAVPLTQAHVLSPESLRTASQLSSPLLMLGGVLDVASMRTRTRLGGVELEGGVLIVSDERLFVVTVDDRVFEVVVDDRVFEVIGDDRVYRPATDGSMEV